MKARVPTRQPWRRSLTVIAVVLAALGNVAVAQSLPPAATPYDLTAAQDGSGFGDNDGPFVSEYFEDSDFLDSELLETLERVDFLDEWFAYSPVHPSVTLLQVDLGDNIEPRQAVLDAANEIYNNADTILLTGKTLIATEANLIEVENTLVARRMSLTDTRAQYRRTEIERNRQRDDLAVVIEAVEQSAVAAYVGGQTPVLPTLNVDAYNDNARYELSVESTIEQLLDLKHTVDTNIAGLDQDLVNLTVAIGGLEGEIRELEDREAALIDAIAELKARLIALQDLVAELQDLLPTLMPAAHEARMLAHVPILDEVPLVAVDAYVQAAANVPSVNANCGIRWQMLAGIAKVETGHGTFKDTELDAEGNTNKRILGPLLNGSVPNTAIITDTDGGVLDADAAFDAAVGPFQFIPGTWRGFDWDGNGDQVANPHNMYDGALSAAVYLCTSGPMVTPEQIRLGVLIYNESDEYVVATTGYASLYDELVLPEPLAVPEFELPEELQEAADLLVPPGRGTKPVTGLPSEIAQSKVVAPPPGPVNRGETPPDSTTPTTGDDTTTTTPGDDTVPAPEPEVVPEPDPAVRTDDGF